MVQLVDQQGVYMLKKSFLIWADIAFIMMLVIFIDFILFQDMLEYWHLFFYVKDIFISIFIFTIIISVFVTGYFFEFHRVFYFKNRFLGYLKLYFSILWRALVIVVPIIGAIAYIYHGSLNSRVAVIIIEVLAGFPAIYWYMKKIS